MDTAVIEKNLQVYRTDGNCNKELRHFHEYLMSKPYTEEMNEQVLLDALDSIPIQFHYRMDFLVTVSPLF